MNILAIETSTEHCSVAMHGPGKTAARHANAGQRHSELVLPMIDEVLRESGLSLRELAGIAFGAGPGSFTGLRIACGVAQGLAFGAGIRLAPIGTLLALAEAVHAPRVLACLDARMGEVYHAAYERRAGTWHEIASPVVCPARTAPLLPGAGWVGCGSGFEVYGEALAQRYRGQLERIAPGVYPGAREIARLAVPVFASGAGVAADEATPLYVRDKVALKISEQR